MKHPVGAKRLEGKRPGAKRLGGETTRGENCFGAKRLALAVYGRFFPMTVPTRTLCPGMFRPISIYITMYNIFVTCMALYNM